LYCRVWDLLEFGEAQEKLLPHPSFVYCSQFHSRLDTIAVTGSYDQVIRVWDVGDDGTTADVSTLLREPLCIHLKSKYVLLYTLGKKCQLLNKQNRYIDRYIFFGLGWHT